VGAALAEHADPHHGPALPGHRTARGHHAVRGQGHHEAVRAVQRPVDRCPAGCHPDRAGAARGAGARSGARAGVRPPRGCAGAQLHLSDPAAFDPVRTGYTLLSALATLYPEQQLWREAAPGRPHFLDLLWGSPALREGIDAGHSLDQVLAASPPAPTPPPDTL